MGELVELWHFRADIENQWTKRYTDSSEGLFSAHKEVSPILKPRQGYLILVHELRQVSPNLSTIGS